MMKLTGRYAKALLAFAEERSLEAIYRQALTIVVSGDAGADKIPAELGEFTKDVVGGEDELMDVLYAFLDLARERLDLLEVEVISAIPLTDRQLAELEKKLILMFRKQLDITAKVDPSILGGLRVIAGTTVLDDTIRRKLMDMKGSIYKGVYFSNEHEPR